MKFFKLMFSFMLIMSILISISSNSWLGMWMGLEINLLSIIPLMNNKINSSKSEASMKYFIVQALASTILLFSIILSMKEIFNYSSLSLMINSSLLTKMGAAPFHFWIPEVIEGLDWMNSFIILTIQKFAPSIILMYNISNNIFINFIIIMCMLIGGLMGFNQISLRKLMAYSSINHLGWMIAAMIFCKQIFITYISIYTIISMSLISIFNLYNSFYIQQIIFNMNNLIMKMIFSFNMMSLGGLPPFLGFLPKWMVIYSLIMKNFNFTALIMIILTLITLFYYIRIIYSMMILKNKNFNFNLTLNNNNSHLNILHLIPILGLIPFSLTFIL
uniref:NADH-ubiquinone oxidoreductase chain 2 n=1 Tax=Staphylinoidea sp. 7 KM-2017 TaxID=2219461 RepID=A0A346RI64_9COLE|nr:NADH dehydrogenase subunit 2 [Staphylinoidea sp. 7 KM-2017]